MLMISTIGLTSLELTSFHNGIIAPLRPGYGLLAQLNVNADHNAGKTKGEKVFIETYPSLFGIIPKSA